MLKLFTAESISFVLIPLRTENLITQPGMHGRFSHFKTWC